MALFWYGGNVRSRLYCHVISHVRGCQLIFEIDVNCTFNLSEVQAGRSNKYEWYDTAVYIGPNVRGT